MTPTVVNGVDEAIEAIQAAQRGGEPIKLVLTDMYMPRRDGFELIEWIRHESECPDLKIMVLSSGPTPEHRTRAAELNVDAYMTKPVKQSILLDAIARSLSDTTVVATPEVDKPAATETRSLNILIAEDNPVNQETATLMFQKLGHTVTIANNGVEALELLDGGHLDDNEFDIVFMDVQMPELDGKAATGKIRENEKTTGKHQPIVAMTAHAMKGDREECLEAGMDDYISKPIRRKALKTVVDRVVERFWDTDAETGADLDTE
jgi:CheY-like chemotaxis protein